MESHTAADATTNASYPAVSRNSLSATVSLRSSIEAPLIEEMYKLYAANYLDTSPELFRSASDIWTLDFDTVL